MFKVIYITQKKFHLSEVFIVVVYTVSSNMFRRTSRRMDEDFFTSMMPSYFLEMILGTLNFRLKGPIKQRTFQLINIKSTYKILFFIFYFVILMYKLRNDYSTDYSYKLIRPYNYSENLFNWFVMIFDIHCDLILQLLLCVGAYLKRNVMLQAWKDMFLIDEKMAAIQIFNKHFYISITVSVWIILNIITNFLIHFIAKDTKTIQSTHSYIEFKIIFFILNTCKISIVATYMSWMMSLNERFYNLKDALKKRNHAVLPTDIIQIRDIHRNMCYLLNNLNKMFSLPMIMNLSIDIYVILMQVYIMANLIYKMNIFELHDIVYVIFLSFFTLDLLTIVLVTNNLDRNVWKLY